MRRGDEKRFARLEQIVVPERTDPCAQLGLPLRRESIGGIGVHLERLAGEHAVESADRVEHQSSDFAPRPA